MLYPMDDKHEPDAPVNRIRAKLTTLNHMFPDTPRIRDRLAYLLEQAADGGLLGEDTPGVDGAITIAGLVFIATNMSDANWQMLMEDRVRG